MKDIRKILKIIGGLIILVIFIMVSFYINNKISSNSNFDKINTNTGLSLEEIAEKENKNISEFIPAPSSTKSLEEIAEDSLKTLEDLIPEQTESLSLEEIAEKEGKDFSEFIPIK